MQQPVTLPNSEVHLLQSAHIDQEYKIFVSLPMGYNESKNTCPVLYVTDANWVFGAFYTVVQFLQANQSIPPMIVVGIGYPTEDNSEIFRLRSRDFLPTVSGDIESGGADDFVSFIQDDLFPFIADHYRTDDSDRTLWGYSYGGTFGTYVLFKQRHMFSRYIILAPTLIWDDHICFDYERQYAEEASDLPTRLHLSVGTLDEDLVEHNASLLIKFHAVLKSRNYPSLKMQLELYEGENHLTSAMPCIMNGLRSVFADT